MKKALPAKVFVFFLLGGRGEGRGDLESKKKRLGNPLFLLDQLY